MQSEMRPSNNRPLRIAIIGCGAVAELCHLPAVQQISNMEVVALVDRQLPRAETLAKQFGVSKCLENYQQLSEVEIDGVIIGLPNYLHASVSKEFLTKGIAVLVEKPMALTVTDAEEMVDLAKRHAVPLQVGLMSRYFKGAQLIKRALMNDWLGKLEGFSLENGLLYDWPAASGGIVLKDQAGGGQLVDIGSHMLDLLLWWFGEVKDVEYRDDSLGGVESDCELSLTLDGPTGPVSGTVVLSRLRNLSNVVRIVGEQFTLEWDLSSMDSVRMWPTHEVEGHSRFITDSQSERPQSWHDAFVIQLEMFAQSILTGERALTSGDGALGTVALIEQCYRERKPVEWPWMKSAHYSMVEVGR
ncbi:Gfo/Idh/MocA family oxidoreductase [Candidatus Nitronereus thalassa]|uniref:Gfo/Idh/MocA family oxidoreductase n=1 Tax=Candidatus Nitronereus thalassa TaxID=3020898 RepID=A0ABU3K588_9BACT|nr:Gfo/Idh/MocA family oxidoreductase [Candidatus Nitronereus thalassa]MDT7041526.1 Gfo/Idh/MocA family oxidoreductase [Candidatus Nitronereus thalassa]